MRHVFIGDIHGCLDEFKELVEKLDLRSDDQVVCLGDFMDKGPDPVGCVRFARLNGFTSILGNHEERHVRWRRNVERELTVPGYKNGMRAFSSEDELRQNAELSAEDLEWFLTLPYYQVFSNFVAVHGGLLPGLALTEQPLDKIIRARWVNSFGKPIPTDYESKDPVPPGALHWTELYTGAHNVVYGHEAHSLTNPRIDERRNGVRCFGIDTGCVHGGRLTALVLEESDVRFVQVQARRVYKPLRWAA